MTQIIDGKKLAQQVRDNVRQNIKENELSLGLAVILIGEDPASTLYVKLKRKAAEKAGINFHLYKLPVNITEQEVLDAIKFLNQDEQVTGILVQLPLPKHLDQNKIIQTINPQKDVDGFHPDNINNFLSGQTNFIPGLARGIELLIKEVTPDLTDKKLCILANSDTFTETLEKYFTNQGCLTTHCHLNEPDWIEKTKQADILIVAVGKPLLIKADNIKKGAIVIDVGTNRLTDHTIVGDVDYDDVIDQCTAITPVPGGVGPMTIAMLLDNCVKLAQK
ncbi:MAG: bifunctional methylenetetrahydrofolate dehydrogenase/methenyltetrahydrofolate cyclohydrolase [Candidatus Komeilibacteria bacterium CG_4_9_14_0_8_um_filter_36_9]|uniref:Bifunctional protein FolD n=1 Tax=Candidatus Komeilibacteria bacterium CG_4_9_14_0_8_um_filter_36_9 TaxID=1974473 RepID=A0A2M8DRB2_9BACT|nr:MAG: bifunctional methylenetetrahydrofolate dehydrogenase/methenyltetrahydrofolate cyclohydrolase [Candidatus Komeilibacteria bacterium CG_4_9_14_0_8_um_filter_36_9]